MAPQADQHCVKAVQIRDPYCSAAYEYAYATEPVHCCLHAVLCHPGYNVRVWWRKSAAWQFSSNMREQHDGSNVAVHRHVVLGDDMAKRFRSGCTTKLLH